MRLPVVPTLMVAAMVPVMIGLGIWQLHRAEWKESLLADLSVAPTLPPVDLDTHGGQVDINFRRVMVTCSSPAGKPQALAGQNMMGASGFAFRVACREGLTAVAGWSQRPEAVLPAVPLGRVAGLHVEAPGGDLVYLDTAVSPLERAAPPSIDTIPNNHRAYAVQWFLFAAILGVIYAVYVGRRQRQ